MKSRTSSFNTALRKNILRFAPCWVLYTICLVLVFLLMTSESPYWLARNMADWILVSPLINLGYAFLVAQLLFGDLFNSRMCNALHAMPLRREGWFAANTISGLLFHLIPTLITALVALSFLTVNNGFQIVLLWLLGCNLTYLCFVGIATFCVHLTGNRFAMLVVYGIVNFAAVILYWLVDTLYTPMIVGVRTNADPFFRLTPVVHMMQGEYLDVIRAETDTYPIRNFTFSITEFWPRLLIWAGVGLILLVLALVLYRKRKLECAGDFMAFKGMEPVFLIIYTLILGTCFQFFASNILGLSSGVAYLFVGLAVGWFTGQMLIKRTIRVFQWKVIGGCLVLMALITGSLLTVALDIFGIERWVPEASQVETVYVYRGYASIGTIPNTAVALTDSQDIETIRYVHALALETQDDAQSEPVATYAEDINGAIYYEYWDPGFNFTLIYQLENGRTVYRYYRADATQEIGQILRPWFSTMKAVLGFTEAEMAQMGALVVDTYIEGCENIISKSQVPDLLEAIAADCREGNMVQGSGFHTPECSTTRISVEFTYPNNHQVYQWFGLTIYGCATHTVQWMEENHIQEAIDAYLEATNQK